MRPIQISKTVYLLVMLFCASVGIFTPVIGAAETTNGLLDEKTFFIK